MSSAPWHIQLFGVVTASRGDRAINSFRTQQTARILACLAYRPDRVWRRDELVDLMWPDVDPPSARNRLNVALSALRRDLGDDILLSSSSIGRNHIQLDKRLFTTDSSEFESLLRSIDPQSLPEKQIELYEKALALYRGDLLPGLDDIWASSERQRISEQYLTGIRRLSKLLVTEGRHSEALEQVRRAIHYEPLCEDMHRLLVRLLCALGRRTEALGEYSTLADRLKREYGIAPCQKTQDTIRELLFDTDPARGKTNVKEKPAAATVPTKSTPKPLAEPAAEPLFGRDEFVFQISSLLRSSDARLVSLTGIGGTGKSRLAVAVGATLADVYGDDIRFVHLADATELQHIEQAILRRIGIRVDARTNIHLQVVEALSNRPVLLILDNMEQLLPSGASVVRSLLDELPQLKCLVTSRQRLNLSMERERPVTPLQTPSLSGAPHRLIEFPSVQLFLHRANLVSHGFEITTENADCLAAICHHLEGLPLAIEMAAAWTRVMSPAEILKRLTPRLPLLVSRDVDKNDRHASVRRTLERSYEQMPPELQRLFARLSIFRGGWSTEAAEAVGDPNTVLIDLMELRDRSLLKVSGETGPIRNSYLEVVREFASERLQASGEFSDVRKSHVRHFLDFAERARPLLCGPEANHWLDMLDSEQENLRQALRWTLGCAECDVETARSGTRLANALCRYWLHRGNLVEGIEWMRKADSLTGNSDRTTRANVKLGLGSLCMTAGDYLHSQADLNESIVLFRMLGDQSGEAAGLNGMGSLAFVQGDWPRARDYYENALNLHGKMGDVRAEASVLSNLANVASRQLDPDTAMVYFDRCLDILRTTSDTHTLAGVMVNSVGALLVRNDLEEAEKRLLSCVELSIRHGYPRVLAHCFEGVAEVGMRRARRRDAAIMYAAAASIRKRINAPLPPSHRNSYTENYEELRTYLGPEIFEEAWAQGSHLSDDAAAAWCTAQAPTPPIRVPAR